MANLSTLLARVLTDHSVNLLRTGAGIARPLLAKLGELEVAIQAKLLAPSLTLSSFARLTTLLTQVRKSTDNAYRDLASDFDKQFQRLTMMEVATTAKIVNKAVGVDLVEATLPRATLAQLSNKLLIQGAPSADWWGRQAQDLAFRFAVQVRTGMGLGETNEQIVRRVVGNATQPGIFAQPRKAVRALVQTSVQTGANAARLAVFKANEDVLKGVQQISTLDDRTTEICIAYDHAAWDLDGNPLPGTKLPFNGGPPRHWNCRSVLVPLTKSWAELGSKIKVKEPPAGTRASMDGQVASSTDFGSWFASRSKAEQDQILGAGKAQLWRDGKISMTSLLDQSGRPLSLQQLSAKYD